jgi:hypothetical protein
VSEKIVDYESVQECPKCGAKQYVGNVDGRPICMNRRAYIKAHLDENGTIVPECLDRVCSCCGYSWKERCRDSQEGAGK